MINDEVVKINQNKIMRSVDDIRKEYALLCGEAGDASYMIKELESTLAEKHERLFHLKREFQELERQNALKPTDETLPFNKEPVP